MNIYIYNNDNIHIGKDTFSKIKYLIKIRLENYIFSPLNFSMAILLYIFFYSL